MTKLFPLIKDNHLVILGKTQSGKTTLIKTLFLEPFKDGDGDKIFRCHIFPDYHSIQLYRELGIPIFETAEQLYEAYTTMKHPFCAFDPPSELQSGIPPKREILFALAEIFRFKEDILKTGDFSTHRAYFFIDEIQRIMDKHNIPSELETVLTEGLKHDMYLIGASQRVQLVHHTTLSQSNTAIGRFETWEKGIMDKYHLPKVDRRFTFILQAGDKRYKIVSKEKSLSSIKKSFNLSNKSNKIK